MKSLRSLDSKAEQPKGSSNWSEIGSSFEAATASQHPIAVLWNQFALDSNDESNSTKKQQPPAAQHKRKNNSLGSVGLKPQQAGKNCTPSG